MEIKCVLGFPTSRTSTRYKVFAVKCMGKHYKHQKSAQTATFNYNPLISLTGPFCAGKVKNGQH